MDTNYKQFIDQLSQTVDPKRIITDSTKCLAYGTDASFYRLTPKIVLQLTSLDEVILAVKTCYQLSIPCTFRAAGTSLSGQAISDSVLITLTDDWRGHTILDGGEKIQLQPGVIGADANRYLAPYGRKIGPDPASINTCKIGGIAANNASGMCCGTAHNTYKTVSSMKVVLSDGTLLDTSCQHSINSFKQSHSTLYSELQQLCEETQKNTELAQRISHKYRLKNTTGYSLNALVDFTDPIDALKHLMVGSEGTLGFIAEITYNTVVEHPYKASTLLVFKDIETASHAVTLLTKTPVDAVEMMDGRALHSVANKAGMPAFIKTLDLDATALLVETRASNHEQLQQQNESIMAAISEYPLLESIPFTTDPDVIANLWGIRKGLFPAVGAVREVGTSVIIEDVAFPVESLAAGVRDLQALFDQFHYDEAIIFGHALEGNLHFVFTQGFESQDEITRYGQFMDEVSQLVAVKYQGSLKAEHGTGRNMAPYVELEWGKDGYQLMQKIKKIMDPTGILNPGVIINDDKNAHITHLKPMPAADDLVDRCIECGFCEPVCPSRTLTLSPRQRIVLYREIQRQKASNEDPQKTEELYKLFKYQGIDTCAATGLCADRCPVGINTGDLVKQLRTQHYQSYQSIAKWTADHFAGITTATSIGLSINKHAQSLLGDKLLSNVVNGTRKLTKGSTPKWIPELPTANHSKKQPSLKAKQKVVYMPSCASRTMGQQADNVDQRPLTEVTMSLLEKAGYEIIQPNQLNSQCCGMPYDSKGMTDIATEKSQQLEEVLWQASEQGKWPILMDTSPCAKRSIEQFSQPLAIYEPAKFTADYLLDKLAVTPIDETVMLHVTCSSRRMGLENTMLKLAKACAKNVVLPEHIQCCGWAGDKGFTTPELNEAAVSPLKSQVPSDCSRGFSNSRTCEIGLSHHSGVPYQSILYLVDEASQ